MSAHPREKREVIIVSADWAPRRPPRASRWRPQLDSEASRALQSRLNPASSLQNLLGLSLKRLRQLVLSFQVVEGAVEPVAILERFSCERPRLLRKR